jgi:hypothetical protein
MDRETAITRALSAFWREIETIYPRTIYHGISAETFNALRGAALAAVTERVSAPGRPALPDPEHDGEMANNYGHSAE